VTDSQPLLRYAGSTLTYKYTMDTDAFLELLGLDPAEVAFLRVNHAESAGQVHVYVKPERR
jgi:hypothetical protein